MLDPSKLQFIQASHFQPANRDQVDWIVVHTMEIQRTGSAALDCARDFATTTDARSAHYCIDSGTIIHCVQEKDIAYAAPPNAPGMHLEHAGFASLSAEEWQDDYSTAMLRLSAQLAASIALRFAVPVVWLSSQDLLDGKRGLTSHANISDAYHRSTHQDPGPNFPHDDYVRMVQAAIDLIVGVPSGVTPDVTSRILRLAQPHMAGTDVQEVQEALVKRGHPIAVDGDYGLATQRAVKALQRAKGLSPDGVVGPLTRRVLELA